MLKRTTAAISGGRRMLCSCTACLAVWAGIAGQLFAADWPTQRGNVQRTGCIDGQLGPQTGKVLWAMSAKEDFVASPVIAGETLIVSGIAGRGQQSVTALSTDPKAAQRAVWTKTAPYLKLAVMSSPAYREKLLVFGDGMHTDNGSTLHGLSPATGDPLWQFRLTGDLIHMEGGPTLAGSKVLLSAGDGGVICLDPEQLTLDGKPIAAAAVAEAQAAKFRELQAKYEADKKKDPDFAVPPSKNDLPQPQPKQVWQQGLGRWHVDAGTAVQGDKVFACSAFLEHEKKGERTIAALGLADGAILWKTPLTYNPWAGPTLAGELVIVGGSTIRFEPQTIPEGKGEVVAVAAADGKQKWRLDVAGGVLSPVAATGELAVFTATDGKVRAVDLASGTVRWTYNAKSPLFAGVAIAGETVYTADLKGVVHAISLSLGKKVWTLDLAADPAVKAAGMVYGSPVVHGGRLYLATNHLGDGTMGQPTVVVCIGDK